MSISLPLNSNLITIPEKKQIEFETDQSTFSDEKKIFSHFKTLENQEQVTVIVELGEHLILGAAKGAAGGFVGGFLVSGPTLGALGAIIGGLPGFFTGYKIGAALSTFAEAIDGGIKGIKEFEIKFISSDKYKVWIEEARKTDVYPVYQKIIEDPRFENYICPLSYDLIRVPVRAPDGKIYEQTNIVEWIKIKEGQIKEATDAGASVEKINAIRETISPMRIRVESFTVADLRYCPDYFKRLDTLAKIKISEMEDNETKKIFQTAVKVLQASHFEDRKVIIAMQILEVTQYVRKHKLNLEISKNVTEKLLDELEKIEQEEKSN
jgi:hypothetical protein